MTANILIVDDSLTVRMDLTDAFDEAGFSALACENVAQAKSTLAATSVGAAILDVNLPDGDGIELLRELRARFGAGFPVLMLTTEAEASARLTANDVRASEYVGKPYDSTYVIAKVRELLEADQASSAAPTVLLIDDSLTFREELGAALRRARYRVVTAETGEEGLRLAASKRPAAVVVDGILPGMDGAAVIRRIRLDPALRALPCVLLTGQGSVEAELGALDSGADAFIHKGDDPELMLAKVHAVLRTVGESRVLSGAPAGRRKILVVDDSATYREELKATLGAQGYDVLTANSGEEALEVLAVQPVDSILLDLMMPGMGGKETCAQIKSSHLVRDIPVIVLTGVDDRASMLECLAIGADDYVEKSSTFEALLARVRAQLRRRQFEEETRSVREQLLRGEIAMAEARAAHELAETRAQLVTELQAKNEDLNAAYQKLQAAQTQLVQSAKMASLGELVAGVAHEINNPLAFVLTHVNTSRKSLDKIEAELSPGGSPAVISHVERARSRMIEIKTGLDRIRDLVLKLRTFSRLDEGYQKQASIKECVESVLTILNHRLGHAISVHTEFGDPDVIECFPSLLNQAIMNIIANAIDAMSGQESGTLRIRTGANHDAYAIVITDNGPGIPPEIRERVLEPFFTTKPVGQGTGLGLSITYSIILRHGGTLELGDNEGGGTAATIRIPLELKAELAHANV